MVDLWDMIGSQIRMKGKTNHGKNRIREQGDLWTVVGFPHGVSDMNPKPSFPCLRADQLQPGLTERWFDPTNFEIVEVVESRKELRGD